MAKSLIFIISMLIFNIGFAQNSTKKNETKDYFNTRNIKTIHKLGSYQIKINKSKIYFNKIHGNISSPLKYSNLYTEFDFNNTYEIKDSLSNTYYFKFGWVSFKENETMFSNINWIDDNRPKEIDGFSDFEFSVVNIDYIQFGNISLCTIGDSQTWWSNAQNLRKFINQSYPNLIFIGSNTDVFGYGHEGEGGNSTYQLIKRINRIPKADYYTLLIGTNDWKNDIETTFINIVEVTESLTKINSNAKILYLTPIPTENEERDSFNTNLKDKLVFNFKENKNVVVIDLGNEMRKNDNWKSDYLSYDGLHQSIQGVQLMGKLIAMNLKTISNNVYD
ncbi:MAG: SGNH/GDSL hydrolase family protein [Psychroserpens sp.]|uniref:SGNH/GDSL hydrolase family protein n=1 Tax=Psychroserpens sp. TaxID=2020870 RepID=UPI003CA911C2